MVFLASLTSTAKLSQNDKKKEMFPSFLDNNLNCTDTVLMGLYSIDADLKRPDDVTNWFNFDNQRSTASRTSESTPSAKYLEIVQYESGLQSSLKKTDTYSAISMVDSTGNAPNNTSTQPVHFYTSL